MLFSKTFAAALGALASSVVVSAASSSSVNLTPTFSTIEPTLTEIEAAAATAVVGEETSTVTGKVFDHFFVIWLENTDYDAANTQADLEWLAQYGIKLTNYLSLTHPSEPNYVAAVGGDYFGMNSDNFFRVPSNVSNIVDLLESKNISWAEYQEHQPYAGFEGFNYSNQETFANDYVRKHNPLVIYDSIANNQTRLDNIKNFTSFYDDLEAGTLPQWAFITPNMTNDGHDTTIDVSGSWSRTFLEPLLNNTKFMSNTLVLLTFDENETYTIQNKVWALLLGDVISASLQGTTDDTVYTHYSEIATVEANWDLPHLGRGDADANVFSLVANDTSIALSSIDVTGVYNNESVAGYYNDYLIPIAAPDVDAVNRNGQSILPAISSVWAEAWSSSSSASAASAASATTSSASSSASATASSASSAASSASAASSSGSASSSASATATTTSSSGAAGSLTAASGLLGLMLAAVALM
ncbi:putative acid phosphatase [Limtongia smithiae]|uniref:putative acid phosphatase n=1 Tax=Limtongia smithiae TaxID=1125753 RepID=UPI0034CDEEAE